MTRSYGSQIASFLEFRLAANIKRQRSDSGPVNKDGMLCKTWFVACSCEDPRITAGYPWLNLPPKPVEIMKNEKIQVMKSPIKKRSIRFMSFGLDMNNSLIYHHPDDRKEYKNE